MSRRPTADERLIRIVQLITNLRGRGPRRIEDLADELGITPDLLLADVHELLGRIYYRPGGWVEDIQIFLEGDTVTLPRSPAFLRPTRLSTLETLCLVLALGSAVAQSFGDTARLEKLMAAAQQHLASADWTEQALETVLTADFAPDPVGIRQLLIRASRERTPCTITYLKPGQRDAEVRTIHPLSLVHSGGHWYALAWCTLRDDVRQFRVDRILDGVLEEGTFEIPESMPLHNPLPSYQLQRAEGATMVQVWYDAEAAPWVIEDAARRGFNWVELPDGRVEIVHRVGDVAWLLHHILSLAPAAEVIAPLEVRALVARVLDSFLDMNTGA
jgi:predicted DNA-binding transcriptional regulator YafY